MVVKKCIHQLFPQKTVSMFLNIRFIISIRFSVIGILAAVAWFFSTHYTIGAFFVMVQWMLLSGLLITSGAILFCERKNRCSYYLPFFMMVADSVFLALFVGYNYKALGATSWVYALFFPAASVLIAHAALYNRRILPLFTGVSFFCSFCAVWSYITLKSGGGLNLLLEPLPSLLFLLIASFVTSLVSCSYLKTALKILDSEGALRNLGKVLPIILFKVDREGTVIWAEVTSPHHFGLESNAMVGKDIRYFIDAAELYLRAEALRRTYKAKNFNKEVLFIDCSLHFNENDGTWEGSFVDVTDRQHAIVQREEMEQRLFQYQKMDSLGALASGMAHDFNHILQTIAGLSDRITAATQEPETKKHISEITSSLSEAHLLTTELVALGRKKPLNYSFLQVDAFLRDIMPHYAVQLGGKFELKLLLSDELLSIQADSTYLKRVFQNLIGNAQDAMPEGGTITIEAFKMMRSESAESTVVIRVSDTGAGIAPMIADRIFDPFFSTKKKGKGTGLGLAVVRRIVALHKGTISLEKSDSSGTVFRIELPFCDRDENDVDTKKVLLNRINAHLIILDDDERMRKINSFFLSEFSYTTFEAATVDEGLAIVQNNLAYCCVLLLDWKMPNHDPHKVIQAFRTIKPDLIIIVVSGYQPDHSILKNRTVFRWITKPYDRYRLDLEIQKALYLKNKSTCTSTSADG
ncbi:MAG: response regulator [Chitinivibrionales bacterium]|nr:response regulator [Chitinivibrionales bacterium]